MGNIGSQTGYISHQRPAPEDQWVHSFPRTQPSRLNHQHKVLPERNARQKLRPTNNGEILHSGGTLTGRQNRVALEKNNHYPSRAYAEHNLPAKTYFSNERDPLHKSRSQGAPHRQNATSQKALQEQMKLFVSEPDLRYSCPVVQDMREKKAKKKYKAPPPPQNNRMNEKLEWEENSSDNDFPTRKPRLFKTRAETKKNSSHVNKHSNVEYTESANCSPTNEPYANLRPNRLSLPELKTVTSDDFQKELKEATKRLRHIRLETKNNNITYQSNDKNQTASKEKLKTLDHNVSNTENVRKKIKEMVEVDDNKNVIINCVRGEASGKESSTPETSPNLIMKDIKSREQPKTFYFGMDEPIGKDELDRFAANLHQKNKIPNSSESDISSDIDSDENNISKIGIDLQLRPILPKKQLEIPRFSPAAAWRLLSTVEANDTIAVTTVSDDVPVFIEERIEKFSRPPPPSVQVGPRSNHDKSGDSGISGDDAIPIACYDDTAENDIIIPGPTTSYLNTQERISWTPQQDLGDDSSMEECVNNKPLLQKSKPTHSGPHHFSLSLPRDNQLAAYMIEKSNLQYSGLQRLKRSVSGVLSNLSSKKDMIQANLEDEGSVNWFLSKSAPNSLSNGFHSLEVRKSQDSDQYTSAINKTSRIMYLPETENSINNKQAAAKVTDIEKEKLCNADQLINKCKLSTYSRSCEDINIAIKDNPETLQDPPVSEEYPWKPNRKSKKFTFQSTIRQIEKKRLSDKLSREAERREKKRLRELEAMQKVEEEFQRKRAREKATIRQQLRLFCMDENPAWSSLPPNLDIKNEVRPEPDGAISSSTTSSPSPVAKSKDSKHFLKYKSPEVKSSDTKIRPPATQELSEYRQIQRDYKEYRGSVKYSSDGRYSKQTTVHPQVTCNMPKAKATKGGGENYRKDFAFGVKSTISGVSTYSEDSQNNSQMYNNKHAPITRF